MTLTIDSDERFIDMIKKIHKAYKRKITCGVEINLSGKEKDFTWYFNKIEANKLYEIITQEEK